MSSPSRAPQATSASSPGRIMSPSASKSLRKIPSNIVVREATLKDVRDILDAIVGLAVFEHCDDAVEIDETTLIGDGGFAGDLGGRPYWSAFVAVDISVDAPSERASPSGKVIGYALWFYHYSTWQGNSMWLEDLFVEELYRGRGIGSYLLATVARKAVDSRCRRMDWMCLDWNVKAKEVYVSLGAKELSEWRLFRLDETALPALARSVTASDLEQSQNGKAESLVWRCGHLLTSIAPSITALACAFGIGVLAGHAAARHPLSGR